MPLTTSSSRKIFDKRDISKKLHINQADASLYRTLRYFTFNMLTQIPFRLTDNDRGPHASTLL